MTADPAGWPDPSRPGYPLHPARDGWHWMLVTYGIGYAFPMLWDASVKMWDAGDAGWTLAEDIATRWHYLGPCILPADLAAERAAAAEAMREACAARLEEMRLEHNAAMIGMWHSMDTSLAYGDGADAIRALPIPSASALSERDERMREEGRREEREACAQEADCGCAARADVLARLATDGEKRASYLCVHGDVCCALQAAAIRARAGQEGE